MKRQFNKLLIISLFLFGIALVPADKVSAATYLNHPYNITVNLNQAVYFPGEEIILNSTIEDPVCNNLSEMLNIEVYYSTNHDFLWSDEIDTRATSGTPFVRSYGSKYAPTKEGTYYLDYRVMTVDPVYQGIITQGGYVVGEVGYDQDGWVNSMDRVKEKLIEMAVAKGFSQSMIDSMIIIRSEMTNSTTITDIPLTFMVVKPTVLINHSSDLSVSQGSEAYVSWNACNESRRKGVCLDDSNVNDKLPVSCACTQVDTATGAKTSCPQNGTKINFHIPFSKTTRFDINCSN